MTVLMPLTVDEVTIYASGYPDLQEWQDRITYDGTNLIVPDDLEAKVSAIDVSGSTKLVLKQYAAGARYTKASGGVIVTSISPTAFLSDPVSRNTLANAQAYATANAGHMTDWKLSDGSFIALDAAQLTTAMDAMTQFVQSCFTCESQQATGIEGGGITTRPQIDAAFATISNVFP
jgi:hypothetical protein